MSTTYHARYFAHELIRLQPATGVECFPLVEEGEELLELYWGIGRTIVNQQNVEGWGAGVTLRLATDLKNELPGINEFSARNFMRMTQFYWADAHLLPIGPPPVAQLWRSNLKGVK